MAQEIEAATTYYVDSQWLGTLSGTAAQPWNSTHGNFGAINTALGSGSVIIYFTARQATVDTNSVVSETHSTSVPDAGGVDVSQKATNDLGFTLTLDFGSFYNSTTWPTAPNWITNPGTNRCVVNKIDAQDCGNSPVAKHSNVIVTNALIVCNSNDKCIAINGDNWEIINSEITTGLNVSNGPAILLVPTADVNHQGSSCPAVVLSNIVIFNNKVHDTYGECIYIGGGGAPDPKTCPGCRATNSVAGEGYPSHRYVYVISNECYNGGVRGTAANVQGGHGQGDGIDVKGGIEMLYVQNNYIHDLPDVFSEGVRGIVIQGGFTSTLHFVAGNKIDRVNLSFSDGLISLGDSWAGHMGTNILANNLLLNGTNNGANGGPVGLRLYDNTNTVDGTTNLVQVYNNTIVSNLNGAVACDSRGMWAVFSNNIYINNNGGGAQVSFGSSMRVASDYNAWAGSSLGFASEGTNSFQTTLGANFVNPGVHDYHLKPGDACLDVGGLVVIVNHDLDGVRRPQGAAWDIGAYEYGPPGALDVSFKPGTGANNNVDAVALQTTGSGGYNGQMVIGGAFTSFNGSARTYVARLNTDGSLDTSFAPSLNGAVYAIACDPAGGIVLGGDFTSVGGLAYTRVARLNADGSVDTTFSPNAGGANGSVNAIGLKGTVSIIIGGAFTTYNGVAQNYVAQLHADGSIDTGYAPSLSDYVYANFVLEHSQTIGGGQNLVTGTYARHYYARLRGDGLLNTTFGGATLDGPVLAIGSQSAGIVVAGGFSTIDGSSAYSHVGRLDFFTGALDTSFNPGTGAAAANNTVYTVAVQTDSKILIGGAFTTYNGQPQNRVARLNSDGTLDTTFNAGSGPDDSVFAGVLHTSGALLIGGAFTHVNGTPLGHIARVYAY